MTYILLSLFLFFFFKGCPLKANDLLEEAAEKYPHVRQLCKPPLSKWPNHELGGITIGWEDAVGIAQAVMQNESLKGLSFHLCNMNDFVSKPILLSFVNHPTLEKVNLGFNDFRDDGHRLITQVIDNNLILKSLDLSMTNFIGDKTTRLFEAVYKSPSLKEFIFDLNTFELGAAKKLTELDKPNPVLEKLSLSYASVSSKALAELACNIHQLKALKSLNLSSNWWLSDKDAEIIALLACHSPLLEELDLSHNNFSIWFVDRFQEQWASYPKDKQRHQKPLAIYLSKKVEPWKHQRQDPRWTISTGPRPVEIF